MDFRGLEKGRGWMELPPFRAGRDGDPDVGEGTRVGGSHRADVGMEDDPFSEQDSVQALAGVFFVLQPQGKQHEVQGEKVSGQLVYTRGN